MHHMSKFIPFGWPPWTQRGPLADVPFQFGALHMLGRRWGSISTRSTRSQLPISECFARPSVHWLGGCTSVRLLVGGACAGIPPPTSPVTVSWSI
jgi:hypothetical protein